jgi:hypothetical protein
MCWCVLLLVLVISSQKRGCRLLVSRVCAWLQGEERDAPNTLMVVVVEEEMFTGVESRHLEY